MSDVVLSQSEAKRLRDMLRAVNEKVLELQETIAHSQAEVKRLRECLEIISKAKHFYTVTANKNLQPDLYRVQMGAKSAVEVIADQADIALSGQGE